MVRDLQREVDKNARIVENLRPFLCSVANCKRRKFVTISEGGAVEPDAAELGGNHKNEPEIIDPIENSVL
jgi:hypothetical protein